ncbi:replication protein A 70 kDa DNA-binding subunit B-like [Spinacia oleracea]|uniref:Replication protein A 70 kDa DNA-binding subunit B-like n=1 Tax=Spinacia oleracea TaxID=3562 RepID=A0ABM3RED0_SPIOL|nr:replication protein A 70 kDa DNA-binding subunit B-like [Spinacia oleracea]XP_056693969.1 replication protein A 70 kDa DNA-binding subunit B-like [Spinacia oleracea]
MGLVLYVSPIENIGVDSFKRDVAIMDTTWTVIKLTLWNAFAHVLDENLNHVEICPIIVACGLHVKSFYGTYLSTGYYTRIYVNPVNEKKTSLSTWYTSEKLARIRRDWFRSSTFSLKSSIDISNTPRIRLSQFPTVRNVQYCRVAAYACRVDDVNNVIYEACNRCLKKVAIFQGLLKCQSCNINNTVTIPRLLLRLTIFDKSGNLKVTILHDLAQYLLGCLATEVKSVLQQPNGRNRVMEKVFACFGNRAFSWVLHPPTGAFNPEHSYTVGYVLHIDWAEECMWLNKYIASKRRK